MVRMERRRFLKGVALAGAAVTLGGAGALQAAPRRLRLSRHRVRLGGEQPLRIVQLTDLHIGRATPAILLRQAVREARRARPDLVVLTGDYLNRSLRHLPALDRLVGRLPRPCVATLGNHDHWSGAESIANVLSRRGITVLRNSHAVLRLRGRELTVVGVDDGTTGHADVRRALARVARPETALVLTHNPRTAEEIVVRGGRLVLAGHTHGGQIAIPRITRALARAGGMRYLSGWYPVGPGRLYVSPGVGSAVIRLRLGRRAAPEAALFELC